MSKTVFTDGDPSLSILGTIITAAFMNAVNNHRHKGADTDGDGAIDYAADTGAADAYVVTLTPALTAHVVGMPIIFKAAHVNTGASTVNINSLGAVAIKKNSSSALAAGDIAAGQIAIVVYDGTYYQLMTTGQSVDLSQFTKSHVANGYQKLPNGLIVQWGHCTISSGTSTVFTFPVAFPNAVLNTMVSLYSEPSPSGKSVGAGEYTTSQITIHGSATGLAISVIIIGY